MLSRRREIVNSIVTELKKINGGVSTFNPSYTYNLNLFNNVFRRIKFIDEVNDFPSAYLQAGDETRIYNTQYMVEAELPIVIRCYTNSPTPTEDLEKLAADVEHVIYSLPIQTDLGIQDIIIDSISNDEGLIEPFGIGEVFITVLYELEK